MVSILICDDEKDIVEAISIYLSSEGYNIMKAYNGQEALDILEEQGAEIKLLLMDIMMPVMDGITAIAKVRQKYNLPVILLTAKSEDTDKILGLNIGADDYVTKPFNPVELIARVKAQLRRYMMLGGGEVEKTKDKIMLGGVCMDDKTKTVTLDGEAVSLTPTEYQILKLFLENPGRVFSPKDIYKKVWEDAPLGAEGTVAVHIRHLREKIEIDPSDPRHLKVVWGQGYKME